MSTRISIQKLKSYFGQSACPQVHTKVYVTIPQSKMLDYFEADNSDKITIEIMKSVVARALGVHTEQIIFSRKCGCSCGCSPGFTVKDGQRRNVFITVQS